MKQKSLLFLLLAMLTSTTLHALPIYEFEKDGIYYRSIGNNEVEVTTDADFQEIWDVGEGEEPNPSYGGSYSGVIYIPDSISYFGTTYYVTRIGNWAFYDTRVTSVIIPESVTSIGNYAFMWCERLSSIDIPNSVTSIGNDVFYFCGSLTSITFPENVTSIGSNLFGFCSELTSINVLPDNPYYDSRDNCNAIVETATNTLISGCMSTIIPESVTCIGDSAFFYCTGLTSITIPEKVTSIGNGAFAGCKITSINIPDGMTSIGEWAFCQCMRLTSINFPNSVTSIGEGAFSECSGLESITIPESITSISDWTFHSCI